MASSHWRARSICGHLPGVQTSKCLRRIEVMGGGSRVWHNMRVVVNRHRGVSTVVGRPRALPFCIIYCCRGRIGSCMVGVCGRRALARRGGNGGCGGSGGRGRVFLFRRLVRVFGACKLFVLFLLFMTSLFVRAQGLVDNSRARGFGGIGIPLSA